MRLGALGACLVLAWTPFTIGHQAAARPHVVFRITDGKIRESSSLVEGTTSPGLFYTANDSGDGPYVYVLDPTGRLLGTTSLSGVDPVDVEAMASGADGSLIVGDIGDNDATRQTVRLYRIEQPVAGDHTVSP